MAHRTALFDKALSFPFGQFLDRRESHEGPGGRRDTPNYTFFRTFA
jgi:hypothetical protein